ncbi:caspase, EACC1-associated type, partial [Nocardia takedensis]
MAEYGGLVRRPDPTRSRAVLIGVGDYSSSELPNIAAVTANLDDLRTHLVDPSSGGFRPDRCVQVAQPRHAAEVGAEVGKAAREATDVLLVYYSGHGLVDERGRLHLAMADSDPRGIKWTSLPFEMVREELLDSKAAVRILILDCCFSGRAIEAMSDLSTVVAGAIEMAGTYTIVSSPRNQTSFAPVGDRNTAFTAALLATIDTAAQHTLDTLYGGIATHLARNGFPRPQKRSVDVAGDLVLFDHLDSWRSLAEGGNADAMVKLAEFHHRKGRGREAKSWWFKAADAGHPGAIHRLGELLLTPSGVDRVDSAPMTAGSATSVSPMPHDQEGATAGAVFEQADVMFRLGLAVGRGDPVEATAWFHMAASAGHIEAMERLAQSYHGRGEYGDAEKWWRRAADAGNADAMHRLGLLRAELGDRRAAEDWHRKAAAVGHTDAMHILGTLLAERDPRHSRGHFRTAADVDAEKWWRRAADAGNADSMYRLGLLRAELRDPTGATDWWRAAADAGHVDAMHALAQSHHAHGEHAEAQKWWRAAADAGHTGAMRAVGTLLVELGDTTAAQVWLRKAADAGHTDAMRGLAEILRENGERGDAEGWYRKAAAAGDVDAMCVLGHLRAEIGDPSAKDWYRQAADAGHSGAMRELGDLFARRHESVESEAWYRKAAACGDAESMGRLGVLLTRRGGLVEGEAWYRKAAVAGDRDAMCALGALHAERGDPTGANGWWRKAADTGHIASMCALGAVFARRGASVEAEAWYRKAADAGEVTSMRELGGL